MQTDNPPTRDDEMTARFPSGLIGVFILVWGTLGDNLAISVALLLLIEGIKLQRFRWNLSAQHFQNIADFTTVLFAVVVVYQFIQHAFHGIYGILGLLPLCLFPLIFAQRLSSKEMFPMSALFLSMRRKISRGVAHERWISTELIYALSCLLAASTNAPEGNVYFYSVIVCCALILFFLRSSKAKLWHWLLTIVAVAGITIMLKFSMEALYRQAEVSLGYWFQQFNWSTSDASRTRTSIGQLGRLKLSDRIVVRIKAPLSMPIPLYLQEANYTKFNLGSWLATDHRPTPVDPVPSKTEWYLGLQESADVQQVAQESIQGNVREITRKIEITAKHKKDVSPQVFPIGSVKVSSNEIIELQKTPTGTILLEAIPGQLEYTVNYRPDDTTAIDQLRSPPSAVDTEIPPAYLKALTKISVELGLHNLPPSAAVEKVNQYFAENFSYSLIGKGYYPGRKPLVSFLTNERSGHCEYFATATALLLRVVGIPTRYAVGYVVDEYSPLEDAFVARARHAHAWTEAYINGHWKLVDTTPGNWLALEESRVSSWQSVQDYLAWAGFHLGRLQRLDRSHFNKQVIWFVPILLLVLMWRLRREMKLKDSSEPNRTNAGTKTSDDDMARVLTLLEQRGITPETGQTTFQFLKGTISSEATLPSFKRMMQLYYRKRFSGEGIEKDEQTELSDGLKEHVDNFLKVK